MQDQIAVRLQQLRAEYKKGQDRLAALEQETFSVKNSMLRISGAIQVLEELLEQGSSLEPQNGKGNHIEARDTAPQ